MTLESKENYPRHTKIVQNSLGFMPEVKPLHKPRGDLVLCAHKLCLSINTVYRKTLFFEKHCFSKNTVYQSKNSVFQFDPPLFFDTVYRLKNDVTIFEKPVFLAW